MSKTKLSSMDAIKERVKRSGGGSVHSQIIDTSIIEDDRKGIAATPEDVYVNVNEDVHVNVDDKTDAPADIPKQRKPKFEDNFTRQTVWVRKEYVELIEQDAEGERGEKTRIINDALDQYFRRRKR